MKKLKRFIIDKDKVEEAKPARKPATLKLGKDTYAMAFKALHWESGQQMNLSQHEVLTAFHSCVIVTAIQLLMLTVVTLTLFLNPEPAD